MSRRPRCGTVEGDLAGGLHGPGGRHLPGVECIELTLYGPETLSLVVPEEFRQEAAVARRLSKVSKNCTRVQTIATVGSACAEDLEHGELRLAVQFVEGGTFAAGHGRPRSSWVSFDASGPPASCSPIRRGVCPRSSRG